MQTVGYGDIVAGTTSEKVFSIVIQLVGASAFGFIIGNISALLERMDARQAAFKRRMSELTEYLVRRLRHSAATCVVLTTPPPSCSVTGT